VKQEHTTSNIVAVLVLVFWATVLYLSLRQLGKFSSIMEVYHHTIKQEDTDGTN